MEDKTLFKQDIKEISIALLVYTLLPSLFVFIFSLILFASHYSQEDAVMISTVLSMVISAIITLQHYTKKFKIKIPTQKPSSDFTLPVFLRYLILALGLFWLTDILFTLFSSMLTFVQFATPDFTPNGTFIYKLFDISYSILLAPIFEELIFRGLMLSKIKKYGKYFSILSVSLIFALFHGNLPQSIPTFFLSMILCAMTLRSNSIYPAIITHIIANSIGIISMSISQEVFVMILNILIIAVIIAAIVLLLTKKHEKIKRESEEPKVREFFNNWASRILLIFCIFNIISMILI